MSYKLFIDDERNPVANDWVIVRSSQEAIDVVTKLGFPMEIAFDHDLGGDDTSIRFINKLVELLLDEKVAIPTGFQYSVHSQNPVGAENIRERMKNILRAMVRKE